ncbi:MAG: hypothetical protein IPF66_10620 [Holophagales bacterium]|nr:hypothetical protein [Holophagales bacterium]
MTIVYPHGSPTFWDAISRGLPEVVVRVQERAIPVEWFTGDYADDTAFREGVRRGEKALPGKDGEIASILASRAPAAGPPAR